MSSSKRLVFSLSDTLKYKNNDKSKNNSKLIMQSVIVYIRNKNRLKLIESMKNGYKDMAHINLEFSEMSCPYDLKECLEYETWLSESDLSNDNNSSEKRRYILC